MKVLLIGNSSIDSTKKVGNQIDNDFDLVARMNRFELEGYQQYLGCRTDIWIINRMISLGRSNVHYGNLQTKFEERKKTSPTLNNMLMMTYLKNENDFNEVKKQTEKYSDFEVGNTLKVSRYLKSEWDKRMTDKFYKPATGLTSIHYLIEEYDNLTIHNFDCGKTKHYWGDTDKASEPMSSKHNWSFDEILISELVDNGKVKYL